MQRKRKKLIRGIIVILILLFIITFSIIKLYSWIQSLMNPEKLELNRLATIDLKENSKNNIELFSVGEHLCKYDGEKLFVYNHNGALQWEKNMGIEEIIIKGNNNLMVIGDTGKGHLYFFDYQGNQIDRINAESKISFIKILTNNYIGVSLEEKNSILVFDIQGKRVTEIQIPKGIINDFDISNSGSVVGVVLLNVEEYEYYTNILLFSLEGRVLAGNKIEESIMYFIKSADNDDFFVLGDNKILTIGKEKGVIWDKELSEEINKIDILDDNIIVINFIRNTDTILDTKKRNTIVQMNTKGEIVKEISIIDDIRDIDAINNFIVAFSDRTFFILDKHGNVILEKKINKDIQDIFWISSGNFALLFKDKLEIMTLNY